MSDSAKPGNTCLLETVPARLVDASWRNYLIVIGIPIAAFCLAFSIGAWVNYGWQGSLLLSMLFWPFTAFLVFAIGRSLHHSLLTQLPTVSLRNDQLEVVYGKRSLSAKVEECHIYRGRAWHVRLVENRHIAGVKLFLCIPVILIDFPPFWITTLGMRHPVNTVAVGYTKKKRDEWERALLHCMANQGMHAEASAAGFVGGYSSARPW